MTSVAVLRLTLAGGIVGAIVGAYWLIDALALEAIRSQRARVLAVTEELTQIGERRAAAERELVAARRSPVPEVSQLAFTTADGVSAAAQIQEHVRQLTAAVGGLLISSQAGAEEPLADGLRRVQVLVRGRFSEESLLRFMAELESLSPAILLTAFEVVPGGGPADQPPLGFTAFLTGFQVDAS